MQHQTIYRIEGLADWSTADAAAAGLSALPAVEDVEMDIVAGTARVTSGSPLPTEDVRTVLAEAGCTLASAGQAREASGVSLGAFVCGLAVALIAGFTVSNLTTPSADAHGAPVTTADPLAHQHAGATQVSGFAISGGGYTLVPHETAFPGPGGHRLSFTVEDANGDVVKSFATVHDKPLHLILVRRDLTGYQHLHPAMSADGVWSVDARFPAAGPWRAYADFTVINPSFSQIALTLGFDLTIAGDFQPSPLPAPSNRSTVEDQEISYQGVPAKGTTVPLLFQVVADGGEVAVLEPYLGAFGHLVILRAGDLGYVHVHPEPEPSAGGAKFWLTVPSSGTYRLFFDYRTHGRVRTAEFTLAVP